jgi:hypothetical protein
MSDKLIINGKKYVSASVAAGMTKYTQDYVGQLCRGDKVNATRIGRNWYVDIDSLLAYKEHSENDVVEIKISASQDIQKDLQTRKTPKVESPNEILEAEHLKGEIDTLEGSDEIPSSIQPKRIVGEHVADYSYDKSPLLPPLKKIATESRYEDTTPTKLQYETIRSEKDVSTPELELHEKNAELTLFSQIMNATTRFKERLALGLVLVVMFAVIFTLHDGEVQYVRDSAVTLSSDALEESSVLASLASVIDMLEVTAKEINSFFDEALYDFLYIP